MLKEGVWLFIGFEGGFFFEEIMMIEVEGFIEVLLGKWVLCIEIVFFVVIIVL